MNKIEPLCPYFGQCGGCASQDIAYETQLQAKRDLLIEVSGVADVHMVSGELWGYRNRLDLTFHPDGIGFRRKGNWRKVVDIEQCLIANEPINRLMREVREFFPRVDAFDVVKKTGTFHSVMIRATRLDTAIVIAVNDASAQLDAARTQVEAFAAVSSANHVLFSLVGPESGTNVSARFEILKGSGQMREQYGDKILSFAVQGFLQTNSLMAAKLQDYVRSKLEQLETAEAGLVDLYGGIGVFGILNADLFKEVLTVELDPGCVEAARKNIEVHGIKNMRAELMDAKHLKNLELPRPLFVIVDPPRAGMHPKTIKALNALAPEVIIYVCCNPKLLRDDLPQFVGYERASVGLFDLFPHTPHAEAVIELRKLP